MDSKSPNSSTPTDPKVGQKGNCTQKPGKGSGSGKQGSCGTGKQGGCGKGKQGGGCGQGNPGQSNLTRVHLRILLKEKPKDVATIWQALNAADIQEDTELVPTADTWIYGTITLPDYEWLFNAETALVQAEKDKQSYFLRENQDRRIPVEIAGIVECVELVEDWKYSKSQVQNMLRH